MPQPVLKSVALIIFRVKSKPRNMHTGRLTVRSHRYLQWLCTLSPLLQHMAPSPSSPCRSQGVPSFSHFCATPCCSFCLSFWWTALHNGLQDTAPLSPPLGIFLWLLRPSWMCFLPAQTPPWLTSIQTLTVLGCNYLFEHFSLPLVREFMEDRTMPKFVLCSLHPWWSVAYTECSELQLTNWLDKWMNEWWPK